MAASVDNKKRHRSLARQLKVKKVLECEDEFDERSSPIIRRASNIKVATADYCRDVKASSEACRAAKRDLDAISGGNRDPETAEKITQLSHLYKNLAEKYESLLKYAVDLKASTELAITCRYQHAMTVAMGDTESASDGRDPAHSAALISSVHRR